MCVFHVNAPLRVMPAANRLELSSVFASCLSPAPTRACGGVKSKAWPAGTAYSHTARWAGWSRWRKCT